MPLTIGTRRGAGVAVKDGREVALALKADPRCDFNERELGDEEQFTCLMHALTGEV